MFKENIETLQESVADLADQRGNILTMLYQDRIEGYELQKELDSLESCRNGVEESLQDLHEEMASVMKEEPEEWNKAVQSGLVDEAQAVIEEAKPYLEAGQAAADEILKLLSFRNKFSSDDTLISEEAFEDYARDLVDFSSSVNLSKWPYNHIDWRAAANELRMEYTEVEVLDCTFLMM
jgi:chromosome segregation ATPase